MKQLQYNYASNLLRLEFPAEWDGKLVTDIEITITDLGAAELLAITSATLYTATTLDEDVAQYAESIFLAVGSAAVAIGDPLLIAGVAGDEVRRVKGYDATTREVILDSILDNAHDATEAVYGLWATYTLDTTTVATWTLALPVTFTWTPTGTGIPITELARVSKSALNIAGLRSRFKNKFPRAYDVFIDPVEKFEEMVNEAKLEVEQDLLANNLDLNRIVDPDVISLAIMAQMAQYWVLQSDDDMIEERKTIANYLERAMTAVKNLPLWADDDQDLVLDEGEDSSHEHLFERGW